MNKTQFIASLAPHFNHKGEDVTINDFGKFKKVDRKARKGRNPFTGETIQIKASKKVRFLPAKALKETIAGMRKLEPAPKPAPVVKPVAKKAAPKKAAKKVAKKAKKAAPKKAKKAAKKRK